MVNHIVLPVYLYSAIHCNPNNNNIVDTNLAHISETFAPNEDARRKIHLKVENVIRLLLDDVDDVNSIRDINSMGDMNEVNDVECDDECNDDECNDKYIASNKIIVHGFSACFYGELESKIDKTTRIQYQFLDRDVRMENGFTMLNYEEYFYLLNTVTKINENLKKNENMDKLDKVDEVGKVDKVDKVKAKWNLVDLINFYMYLKMRIVYFQNTAVAKGNNGTPNKNIVMRDTIAKMAGILGVGNKTISKYVGQLRELGMIGVKLGCYKNGKSSEYWLSDEWLR
jgi:hypothetical protein